MGVMKRKEKSVKRRDECDATGKHRYRDHAEAITAIHIFAVTSTRDRVPTAVYECDYCAGWHSTSNPWSGQTKGDATRK